MFFDLTDLPVRSVQRFEPAGRLDSVLVKNLALRFTLNGGRRKVDTFLQLPSTPMFNQQSRVATRQCQRKQARQRPDVSDTRNTDGHRRLYFHR